MSTCVSTATAVMAARSFKQEEARTNGVLCVEHTRHPCDTYDLAASVVGLLDRLEP